MYETDGMIHYNHIKFMDFKSLPVILCQLPSQISCLGDTYVENSRIPLLTTTTTYKNPIKSVT